MFLLVIDLGKLDKFCGNMSLQLERVSITSRVSLDFSSPLKACFYKSIKREKMFIYFCQIPA